MAAEGAGRRPVIVTATAPTPNGPLHLGHLSGPYVAADIAARAARARGERVVTVSGLDPHQNYVPAKAAGQGRTPGQVLDEYEATIRKAFAAAAVSYDIFIDPRADAGYRAAITRLLDELVAGKVAVIEETELACCADCGATLHHAYVTGRCPGCGAASGGGTCEGCGAFTTAMNLAAAQCARCGGSPQPLTAQIPVLRLESCRDELTEAWATAVLPLRVRQLIGHYLAAGLPDVPLAYPTDWGIGWGPDGLRVDVWTEMGLGLLDQVARNLNPDASTPDDLREAWRGAGPCWHFLGIDNAFYFGILFPALFAGAGIAPGWLGGLVVNEFYRLDGLKFSTSRNHAVWADEFLVSEDAALVRLFLCWDRPDRYESDFTRPAFEAFRDWVQAALRQGTGLPADVAPAEVTRAERALRFESFDPGLALRCLVAAGGHESPLLAALVGEDGNGQESPR
jgi:methionyl-tRNA synthetase